jgi:putative transposase
MFAAEIRRKRVDRMRSLPHWRWHLDEVFVKINGVTHYLWRAVDHEGELLESYVTKRRDRKAALRFLRKSMKRHGQPKVIVTDKLRSYGAGLKDLGMPDDRETGRWLNNRAENSLRGPSVPTCPSDDENALCFAFAGCGPYRSSPLSTHPSKTTSTRSAGSQADTTSRPAAPPLSASGVNFVRPNAARVWANRDWFAFV